MALAWNAGWVNSPRGFKSRILRTRSGVRPADRTARSHPGQISNRRTMSRTVAVVWHASFSVAAGVLYFFFVLPRWPELLGDTSHTLGTVLRIVTGALIGLAALPVVFTLLRTRRPEFGTPQLALTLRTSSIALHVLAGAVIIGAAISRDLDQPRQCRPVAVRHLRGRRGDRPARHLRVLPGLRGRAAAASAQAAQAQEGQAGPSRSPQGRRRGH